jgi:hypothetical protein
MFATGTAPTVQRDSGDTDTGETPARARK